MADNVLSATCLARSPISFRDHQIGCATGLTDVPGGFSGLLFPLLTGVLVDRVSYRPVFLMVAFMPLIETVAFIVAGTAMSSRNKS